MKIAGKIDDHSPNHAISMYFLRFDPYMGDIQQLFLENDTLSTKTGILEGLENTWPFKKLGAIQPTLLQDSLGFWRGWKL